MGTLNLQRSRLVLVGRCAHQICLSYKIRRKLWVFFTQRFWAWRIVRSGRSVSYVLYLFWCHPWSWKRHYLV